MDAWKLDSFRKMFAKEFTFNNGRFGVHSAISRIDKFFISQDLNSRGGHFNLKILGPFSPGPIHMGPAYHTYQAISLF
jgi:hypothetical protein